MKNSIINAIKTAFVALFVIMLCIMNNDIVYAASANVTISSTTVEEGEDVAVTVTISSDSDIAGYHLSVTYDANLLQYVSGGDGDENAVGTIPLFNDLLEAKSETRTLNFKAKKSGSAVISVAAGSSIIDLDTNDMEIASTNGTVTINAHVESSDNNYLSKLEIVGVRENGTTAAYNITQRATGATGFNKNELEYRAYVANDIVKFAVTAVAEDEANGATVVITGVDLEEGGSNTTTITVTAQNGTKRVYEIFTYRVPSEPESESESTTEPESESESEGESESTTTPVDKEVTIGSDVYIITNIAEDTILPEGFSAFEYTYDGQIYIAAKGEVKQLTIMQLVKKGTDEKALYVYDELNNVFYKFINIQIISKMYTVTEKPDDVKIPADFSQSLVNIDGEMVNVWVNKNDTNIYMFYGMNWNGVSGLYLYDATEKTAIRYVPLGSVPASNIVTPEPTTNNAENESDAQKDNGTSDNKIIIIVEACVILILIIVIVIILLKNKDNEDDDSDEDDDLDEDDEFDEDEDLDDDLDDEDLKEDANWQEEASTEELSDEAVTEELSEDSDITEELSESAILASAIADIMEEEAMEEVQEKAQEIQEEAKEDLEEIIKNEVIATEVPQVEEAPVEEETPVVEEAPVEEETPKATVDVTKSIEDMLKDSSTSLNDDELDFVLDKLLSDE